MEENPTIKGLKERIKKLHDGLQEGHSREKIRLQLTDNERCILLMRRNQDPVNWKNTELLKDYRLSMEDLPDKTEELEFEWEGKKSKSGFRALKLTTFLELTKIQQAA